MNATSWSNISTPLTELLSHCAEVNSNQKLILQCVKVRGGYGEDDRDDDYDNDADGDANYGYGDANYGDANYADEGGNDLWW